MFKNYLKIAWRNLWKDKEYSLLNIFGLTLGISCSLFLIFYVLDELSYDRYNENADRIYQVGAHIQEPGNLMKTATSQYPLGPVLKQDFPEIEEVVRLVRADRLAYEADGEPFFEDKIYYADKNLHDVFTFPFLEGSPDNALVDPNSIVLTRGMALKYFGRENNVIGQSIKNSRGDLFQVTGVIEDIPHNSHIRPQAFISSSTLPDDFANFWGSFGNIYTYVLLPQNTDVKAFEDKLLPLYDEYMASIFEEFNVTVEYVLQPLTDIHLKSDFDNEPEETGNMSYIYIFSVVALFMLIIASINYMNLTTARAAGRAKEIGIRKVVGSARSQLIKQFLLESVLITFISTLLSLGLVILLLPYFNVISGKELALTFILHPGILLVLLSIVVLVGLLGGSYPAIYLTGTNPVAVLKGKLAKASSNSVLRKTLVTSQFTISMVMLICTWVVYDQLDFMQDKDLGFNKEQVISIETDPGQDTAGKLGILKNEILKYKEVLSASLADVTPGKRPFFSLFLIETETGSTEKGIDFYGIDHDYFKTLGIELLKGRSFSPDHLADTLNSMIVNENLVKTFGWKEPIGKKIRFPANPDFEYQVVGVVKDFNQKSLYNPIEPLIMTYNPNASGLQAKINSTDIPGTVARLEASWDKIFPGSPIQYNFLDQEFNSQYAADKKRGQIFTAFSVLTILISCLGLLSLVAFTTQQRRKEIGIRKVIGAKVSNIVFLISKSFLVLIAVSCLLAFPIAYLFMNKWLQVFPYKTEIKLSTFLLSAAIILMITLITVGFHTMKSAMANPVKSLRTE